MRDSVRVPPKAFVTAMSVMLQNCLSSHARRKRGKCDDKDPNQVADPAVCCCQGELDPGFVTEPQRGGDDCYDSDED